MRKLIIMLLIIFGLLLLISIGFFALPQYKSFSEIKGEVIDEESNPLEGVKVISLYSCNEFAITGIFVPHGGPPSRGFCTGIGEIKDFYNTCEVLTTDSNGKFEFESLNTGLIFGFPLYNCHKTVEFYKRGYCDQRFYNGKEGTLCPGPTTGASLQPNEIELSKNLVKVKDFEKLVGSCIVFEEECARNSILKEIVDSKDYSRCNEEQYYFFETDINENPTPPKECDLNQRQFKNNKYIFYCKRYEQNYKINPYFCYTEIAVSQGNAQICNNLENPDSLDMCQNLVKNHLKSRWYFR